MNYDYGRFINRKFEYAPRVLIIGDKRIINPTEEHFKQAGYKEIIYIEQPEQQEGFYFTSKIVNKNGIPTQEWIEYRISEKRENEYE